MPWIISKGSPAPEGETAATPPEAINEHMERAEREFGTEPGKYLQFNFYVEKPNQVSITPREAYDLQWLLIGWLREKGYGFDGGSYLGNEWKDFRLQKAGAKEHE